VGRFGRDYEIEGVILGRVAFSGVICGSGKRLGRRFGCVS
jgi:hypothetical protein